MLGSCFPPASLWRSSLWLTSHPEGGCMPLSLPLNLSTWWQQGLGEYGIDDSVTSRAQAKETGSSHLLSLRHLLLQASDYPETATPWECQATQKGPVGQYAVQRRKPWRIGGPYIWAKNSSKKGIPSYGSKPNPTGAPPNMLTQRTVRWATTMFI